MKSFSRVRKAATRGHLRTEQHQAVVKTKLLDGGVGSVFQKLINDGEKVSCPGRRKKSFVLFARGGVFK